MKSLYKYIVENKYKYLIDINTKDEEDIEQNIGVCYQENWANFLRGKSRLINDIRKYKLCSISKEKHWLYHYKVENNISNKSSWENKLWNEKSFISPTIRWKDDDFFVGDEWNHEMYVSGGDKDVFLAEELLKDIEMYRTDKVGKSYFISKWKVEYNYEKDGVPSLELYITHIETGEQFIITMNTLLC